MTARFTAKDLWRTQITFVALAAEAQTVITLRTLAMMGLWNAAKDEDQRMVTEKTDALAKSATATARAVTRGARPDQIALAAMRPLRHKTKPNAARLTKAGPRTPT